MKPVSVPAVPERATADEAQPSAPDLDSIRVRAAMKMLGIKPRDLKGTPRRVPLHVADGSPRKPVPPLSPDGSRHREELFEQKRQELMAELQATAEVLQDSDAERILSPDFVATARAAGRAAMRDDGTDMLDRIRAQAKAEAQKILEDQQNKLLRVVEAQAKAETAKKRLAEINEAKRLATEEKVKANLAKEAKKDELLVKARKQRREDARELLKKLNEGHDKAADHLHKVAGNWIKVRHEREEHCLEVLDRKAASMKAAREEIVKTYVEKEEKVASRLEQKKSETTTKAKEQDDKFTETLMALTAKMEEKQKEKEAQFKKKWESVGKARETVQEKFKLKSTEVHESLDKSFAKRDAVLLAKRKERIERRNKLMEKMHMSEEQSLKWAESRHNHLEELSRKYAEPREIMDELVTLNQLRLARANEFAREQMLARIHENSAKVEARQEQQEHLNTQRTLLFKETMVEKEKHRWAILKMKVLPTPRAVEVKEEEKAK